jgi:hypothetical protein
VHGEDEHPDFAAIARYLPQCFHAPKPRHGKVQQGHIRHRFTRRLNRLLSIGGFREYS